MRTAWRVTELVALPTIGLCVAVVLAPDRAKLAVHIWLLVVLGISLVASITIVHSAYPSIPSPFAASLRRPTVAVERPSSLARIEREVTMAGSSAFDVHYRLRPALVELAAGLLSSRRGIDLEREPGRSQVVLGADVWELVRPDRPQPAQRLGPGITPADLERVVVALEQI
jgi:hypothetical protein